MKKLDWRKEERGRDHFAFACQLFCNFVQFCHLGCHQNICMRKNISILFWIVLTSAVDDAIKTATRNDCETKSNSLADGC